MLEEIERATAAEEEITNNLNAEIARAKAAEAELSTRITTVSDNLATETERAKEAEAALDAKIEAETNRATQKENELQAAIDEIQPPNALTPTHVEHVPTAGTNGYAWGEQATTKTDGIAVGFSADSGRASVAIGSNSYAGDNASNSETKAVAVGITSHADDGGTAIGHNSNSGEYSVAIGEGAEATVDGTGRGRGAVAIGSGSVASQDMTVSVGNSTLRRRIIRVDTPTEDDDAATKEYVDSKIADLPSGTTINSIAPLTVTTAPFSTDGTALAIGNDASATSSNSIAIGNYSYTNEVNTVSFGTKTNTRRLINVRDPEKPQDAATKNYVDNAVGSDVTIIAPTTATDKPSPNQYGLAIGENAEASTYSVAIGYNCEATPNYNYAIGYNAKALNGAGVAIGQAASSYGNGNVAVGTSATAGSSRGPQVDYAIAIGHSASAYHPGDITIGYDANSTHAGTDVTTSSVAIGSGSQAAEAAVVSVGTGGASEHGPATRRIVNVSEPVNDSDAATKNYVDNAVGSVSGGMEFPDYSTFKTLSITSPEAGTSAVTPDVDGYLLLWGTVDISESNRVVTMSVLNEGTWAPILSFPVARTTQDDPDPGPIGSPIPIKAGTTVQITPSDSTITLLSVRHFYRASE